MPKQSRAVLLDLEYTHDCWCIDCTRKLEGASISLVEAGFSYKDSTIGLFSLTGVDPRTFAGQLQKHPWVKEVTLLEASPAGGLASIRFKRNTLVAEAVSQAGCIPMEPSMTRGELDQCTVLVPREELLPELKGVLKERCDTVRVKARKYVEWIQPQGPMLGGGAGDFLKLNALTAGLPEKQREAFLLACDKGYYDNPKRVGIEELAAMSGIHKATFAEHLRKVEARLLPFFAKTVRHLGASQRPI